MTDSPGPCPPRDALENLAAGQAVSDTVRTHVAACPSCRASVDQIREDNRFLASFRVGGSWPAVTSGDTQPPLEIPGYDIVDEVHRGGQGIVYRAMQRSTKRVVAIKVMRQGLFATLADRARFAREIETLGLLDHPNIVAVHDAGYAGGFHYFVMDYIDGAPLDEAVALHLAGPQPGAASSSEGALASPAADDRHPRTTDVVATIIGVFIKVCDAVHAAHLRGVIHRDLKPSNIRVDGRGEPHVLDFGLAKPVEEADASMTRTGQFVGSLPWASPEQVEGAPAGIDLRTDVYSLGAILFQLLTGSVPFEVRSSLRDTFNTILTQDPPRPSLVAAARGVRIDNELETIVLKCLSKDRERRYQSAGELARDLRRYVAGEAIDAKRDSAWYVIRKAAWRKRAVLTPVLVFLLLLPLLLYALHTSVFAARQAARERSLRQLEAARNFAMLEITRRLQARPGSAPDSPGGRLSQFNASAIHADLDSGSLSVSDHGVALLLAQTLRDQGEVIEAESLVRRALVMLRSDYGAQHPEVGRMRTLLAELLLRRGARMAEAEQTARLAVRELTDAFGSAHPETSRGWTTLARILLAQGKSQDALDAARRALTADEDPRSIPRAEALATMARAQAERGDTEAARRGFLEALAAMLTLAHDADARLLDTVDLAAGMLESAVLVPDDLFDPPALRGALAQMPPGAALREIAAVLRGGGDGTERDRNVIPARLAMVALRERLLGAAHPSLGASLASAASSLFEVERASPAFDAAPVEEAVAMLLRAVPLQIAAHGPDSPLVGSSYEKIATCMVDLCRLREATQWYAMDCQLWMRQPAELRDEYQIMMRTRWTAWLATRAGDFEMGLAWMDRALDWVAHNVGVDHPGTALMYACRAYCLAQLGRTVESGTSAAAAMRILDTQTVPEDQRLECRRFLAIAYALSGKPDDARAMMEPAWVAAQADFGRQRPFFALEWTRSMWVYCRAIGDAATAGELEKRIGETGMGDVTAAELAAMR